MHKRMITLSAILFVLCLFGPAALVRIGSSQGQKNLMWKVQSKTTTLYVLGSLHFLRQENYPLNPGIEKAFDQSNILVVEANISDPRGVDPQKLIESASYPENDSLEKHVSKETYEDIKKKIGKLDISPELITRQKPWFLAITLESLQLIKLGLDPKYGVDIYFISKSQGKKKILELESLDEQINLLSNLSDSDQEIFLLYTLRDLNIVGEEINNLIKSWITGDAKNIESILMKSVKENPKLSPIFEKFINERNMKMAIKIDNYLKTKDTYFVVVGAGHLIGDKGIIKILKDKGYLVEQL